MVKKAKGIVVRFDRRKGFGFIQPKKAGEKQVFVHWSEIVSDEQWPVLQKGAEVQFVLNKKDDKGKRSAEKVTKVGGGKITNKEDERDIDEETIYTGTVKFRFVLKSLMFLHSNLASIQAELSVLLRRRLGPFPYAYA